MKSKPTIHPSSDELLAYATGQLDPAQTQIVARHLEGCTSCRDMVAKLPDRRQAGTQVHQTSPGGMAGQQPATTGPAPDLPPELVDHPKYRIVRELGRGGMGIVYQAEHRLMERAIAVKVITRSILEHPEALERFHREVKAAASLDHANIVRAHDAEQAGGLHLLVMEYVEGLSLAQVLERKGRLPLTHACHYIRQAALGLQHAYEQGMVHRDIKPQNLMLTPQGKIKILDFGLARLARERQGNAGLTQVGAFMGTPAYVAPEQATDATQADIRADIYSLGCTLFCLLAGRPPFEATTDVKLVLAHIDQPVQPVHELCPEVPLELSAVVDRMLAKDPAQRYQKPIEVAQALLPFCKASYKSGPVPTQLPKVEDRPAPPGRTPLPGRAVAPTEMAVPVEQGAGKTSAFDSRDPGAPARARTAPPMGSSGWKWILAGGGAAGLLALGLCGIVGILVFRPPPAKTTQSRQTEVPTTKRQEEPPAPAWMSLFNGKDLTGWKTFAGNNDEWRVEDGAIVNRLKGDLLFHEGSSATDFHLRLQVNGVSGNCGVVFRSQFGQGLPDCYKVPVTAGPMSPVPIGSLQIIKGPPKTKERVKTIAGLKPEEVGGNQWFDLEVIARGNQIIIKVNGKTTVDSRDEARSHVAGLIGLQPGPKAVMKVRQVELRKLPPDVPAPR